MQTCFKIPLWLTKLLSIRLELFISLKLVPKMSSIFSRNKLMILIVLFQSLGRGHTQKISHFPLFFTRK